MFRLRPVASSLAAHSRQLRFASTHSIASSSAATKATPAQENSIYVTYAPEAERYTPPSQKNYEYTHEGFNSVLWPLGLGAIVLLACVPKFDRWLTNDGELEHPITAFIRSQMWKEEDSYAFLEELFKEEQGRIMKRIQNSEDRVLYLAGYRDHLVVKRDMLMRPVASFGVPPEQQ
ncbi:hypothetical protein H4R33_003881 [Dimargaris cristalligena]|uniref:Uncharacterized protein n=1 Tax=Dimargaris cristalligena TaxID=215637 RepID=A0A4P9ZU03_9FUNG|nr:hypothetical protein H4R33_003881 [Dimargaris cristalligena]RKP37015.1 hypothetical protein BJ085DRAFT_27097 [Dimargaris cristalligena]|eukprot:RKP37015.1 hypothetical protein BJ085DRAFT_27097 [Dimargaris cristalligena]